MVPDKVDFERHRKHVQGIIAAHRPKTASREGHRAPRDEPEQAELRSWYRTLYDTGLAGAGWPTEWGGSIDHHPVYDVITTEELIRARVPRPLDQVQLASHLLLQFGSPVQKSQHLPRIRSAAEIWCQLFSEPDAGSDLAGIKCRARVSEGSTFTLTGQKTWTTDAHWADMGVALVRTGAVESRHRALTAFLVPMDAPGITIRPIITIGGAHEFNEVYFDDVVLASSAVLGELNAGWQVAMAGLESERFGVGGNVVLLDLLLEDLVTLAKHLQIEGRPAIARSEIRRSIARFAAEAQAASTFVGNHIARAVAGESEEGDAALAKLLYSETYNSIARYGALLTTDHLVPTNTAAQVSANRLQDAWLWSRALTISGGSSEVMRNIVAKRRLHLPSA